MREFSLEGLLVPLIVLLWLLLSFLQQYFRKRLPEQAEAPMPEPEPDPESDSDPWGRMPYPPAPEKPEVPEVGQALVRLRAIQPAPQQPRSARSAVSRPLLAASSARALLSSPRDLRNGIVLMTILGPCRAMDPQAASPEAPHPPQRA